MKMKILAVLMKRNILQGFLRLKKLSFLLILLIACFSFYLQASEKHRIIVLTDIENEPDDAMSLVRFLTYSNQWDVEGLIATTSVHQRKKIATWRIREILEVK